MAILSEAQKAVFGACTLYMLQTIEDDITPLDGDVEIDMKAIKNIPYFVVRIGNTQLKYQIPYHDCEWDRFKELLSKC